MNPLEFNAAAVRQAILAWPCFYSTKDGRKFKGQTVSGTPKSLIDAKWRKVSHLDEHDFSKMGLEIVDAQYVGGAHPTGKFVRVIVASWI